LLKGGETMQETDNVKENSYTRRIKAYNLTILNELLVKAGCTSTQALDLALRIDDFTHYDDEEFESIIDLLKSKESDLIDLKSDLIQTECQDGIISIECYTALYEVGGYWKRAYVIQSGTLFASRGFYCSVLDHYKSINLNDWELVEIIVRRTRCDILVAQYIVSRIRTSGLSVSVVKQFIDTIVDEKIMLNDYSDIAVDTSDNCLTIKCYMDDYDYYKINEYVTAYKFNGEDKVCTVIKPKGGE
jgi:hypothetical protein